MIGTRLTTRLTTVQLRASQTIRFLSVRMWHGTKDSKILKLIVPDLVPDGIAVTSAFPGISFCLVFGPNQVRCDSVSHKTGLTWLRNFYLSTQASQGWSRWWVCWGLAERIVPFCAFLGWDFALCWIEAAPGLLQRHGFSVPLRDLSETNLPLTEIFQAMKGTMGSLKSMTKVCFPTVHPRISWFAANSCCTAWGPPILIFGIASPSLTKRDPVWEWHLQPQGLLGTVWKETWLLPRILWNGKCMFDPQMGTFSSNTPAHAAFSFKAIGPGPSIYLQHTEIRRDPTRLPKDWWYCCPTWVQRRLRLNVCVTATTANVLIFEDIWRFVHIYIPIPTFS